MGDAASAPALSADSFRKSEGGRCPTNQRRRPSGSATVADRPMDWSDGTKVRSRASPNASRWPRFEVTSECSSSSTT